MRLARVSRPDLMPKPLHALDLSDSSDLTMTACMHLAPDSLFAPSTFSQLYLLFVRIGLRPNEGAWRYVRPYHRNMVKVLNQTLGDADKFLSKIQPTHVILCAMLIVLLVQLERLISQASASSRSRR
ncbi:unnamed protein product [Closterium sp. Yama58-4]|nr:unnamed protein product [Closterium sp. Yama58-4]